jgi:chromate transporter
MAKDIVSQGEAIYIVLMLVAFLLSVVFNVHLLLIILGCGIAGYIFEKKRGEVK